MIYFDNSATTSPYKEVVDSFVTVAQNYFGNPSSLHGLGIQAEKLLSQSRKQVASILEVKEEEIIFTSGGTEANNLAIKGIAQRYKKRGNHIITTVTEHPSVKNTCKQLESEGFEVTYLPVNTDGKISLEDLSAAIKDTTILVSVMHVNNEVGSINPIVEIGNYLRKYPSIKFHVDNIQGFSKVPLNIKEANISAYSLSGHKFHGLKGTGILYIRQGIELIPQLLGGGQEKKKRSGTENVAGFVALAKALRLSKENEKKLPELLTITDFIKKELDKLDRVIIHTPKENFAPHIINVSVLGVKAETFVHALERDEVYVSTTSACSSKAKKQDSTLFYMNKTTEEITSSIRISIGFNNTLDEAKEFIRIFTKTLSELRKVVE